MKTNTTYWMAMAAALVPAAGFSQESAEKPLWELKMRLDGGSDPRLSAMASEFFGAAGLKPVAGETPTLRFAGFDNKETPEQDWIAEVRGLEGIGQAFDEIAKEGTKDEAGRVIVKEDDFEFIAWMDGTTALRIAAPPVNAGKTVAEAKPLAEGAWASGWVGLKDLAKDFLDSQTLKLPETLSFTAAGEGPGVRLSLQGEVASDELAVEAKAWVDEMKTMLSSEDMAAGLGVKLPEITTESEGVKVTVSVDLSEETIETILSEITDAIADEANDEE